ncbi:MAG: 2-dehydropantoate 2-reductase [Vibrio sp.]
MNIVVVGPGAIGSLWACYLHQAGHNVSLWARTDQRSGQYCLSSVVSPARINTTLRHNDIEAVRHADVILITTKANQVSTALRPLLADVHGDAIFLFIHNGMGALEQLMETLSEYPLLQAITTHGAMKPSPQQVTHTGLGRTDLGALNHKGQSCQFMAEVLGHALPDVIWHQSIELPIWKKLAINCVINPLTAIHNIRNGALQAAEYTDTIYGIIAEVVMVMKASGVSIQQETLIQDVYDVIARTAQNYSSMHQDLAHQRESEIDFINGYVHSQAQRHHISAPCNHRLWQTVKQLEQHWSHT